MFSKNDKDGKEKEKKKDPKEKPGGETNKELGDYFENMEKKLKLQMTQTKLQRKLDENRGRRNLMKS